VIITGMGAFACSGDHPSEVRNIGARHDAQERRATSFAAQGGIVAERSLTPAEHSEVVRCFARLLSKYRTVFCPDQIGH